MAGFIHEFRARMVESYARSYLAARGGDAAIIMRKELVGSVIKGEISKVDRCKWIFY